MKEWLSLLKVWLDNYLYRKELAKSDRKRLGNMSWYRVLEKELKKAYRFSGPFAISRRAREQARLPLEDLTYGETPLGTAWDILKELDIDQADHIVELGAGRAILSLVAATAFGCKATPLEIIPAFTSRTQKIAIRLGLIQLQAKAFNLLSDKLPEGSVYYWTATTFRPDSWAYIEKALASCYPETRVVSLSKPLDTKLWLVELKKTMYFSWGEATVYFQKRLPTQEQNP